MALGRSEEEYYTEKVVIVNGPTIGHSLKLILLGALCGSIATLYCLRRQEGEEPIERTERTNALLGRAIQLARRTTNLARTVAENILPHWEEAVETGKSKAAETERELQSVIEDVE